MGVSLESRSMGVGVSLESRSMGTWVCPWRAGVWGHGCVPGEQEYGDMGVSLESIVGVLFAGIHSGL